MEQPDTKSRNQGAKIPDVREKRACVRDQSASAEGRADFCSPIACPLRLPTTNGCYAEGCLGFYRAEGWGMGAERGTP